MRWKVTLHDGYLTVDAEDEQEARSEALQALVESFDLLAVEAAPCPDGNPACDGTDLLHGSWCSRG